MVKAGLRLESQVCDTQVIVISATDSLDDLRCGGVRMVEVGTASSGSVDIDERFAEGTAIGKRYVDDAGAEVLVTKPGKGSLSVGETALHLKESKALPASD